MNSSLLHADLNLDNVLIDPITSKINGLIDFDLASFGDPIFDLSLCKYHHDIAGTNNNYYLDIFKGYNLKIDNNTMLKINFYNLASLIFKTHNLVKANKTYHINKKNFRRLLAKYISNLEI